MIAFTVLCRSAEAMPCAFGSPPKAYQPSVPNARETHTCTVEKHGLDSCVSSCKSEKTCMQQAESAQNKRTANEHESFKLRMACSSIGPVFSMTNMLATLEPNQHCSVSVAGVQQHDQVLQEVVSTTVPSLTWYEVLASRLFFCMRTLFSPQSPGRK